MAFFKRLPFDSLKVGFKPIPTLLALVAALALIFLCPRPEMVRPEGWILLGIFIGMIVAVIGKAMPMGAIGLVGLALMVILRLTGETPELAVKNAFESFSNTILWLIALAIMISRAIIKTGLGTRLGYWFISLLGRHTLGVAYGLVLTEVLLATITPSNTARGGAVVHPIMKSIALGYGSDPKTQTEGKVGKYLALVNWHSNPISSAMFLTATAPNPLAVSLLFVLSAGAIHLTWGSFALAMIVPGTLLALLMPLILYVLYPPEIKRSASLRRTVKEELKAMGGLSRDEKVLIGIFIFMFLFWADVPSLLFGAEFYFTPTTTALCGLTLLLLLGILTWEDVLSEKSAWDTLLWFCVLMTVANYLSNLGVIAWFSSEIRLFIKVLGLGWYAAAVVLVLAYVYSHYFFSSATAHMVAMLGMIFTTGVALGVPIGPFGLMLLAATSVMMSITHYATGTAPIIFSSGYVTLGEWWSSGLVMSLVELLVFATIGVAWWSFLGF